MSKTGEFLILGRQTIDRKISSVLQSVVSAVKEGSRMM